MAVVPYNELRDTTTVEFLNAIITPGGYSLTQVDILAQPRPGYMVLSGRTLADSGNGFTTHFAEVLFDPKESQVLWYQTTEAWDPSVFPNSTIIDPHLRLFPATGTVVCYSQNGMGTNSEAMQSRVFSYGDELGSIVPLTDPYQIGLGNTGGSTQSMGVNLGVVSETMIFGIHDLFFGSGGLSCRRPRFIWLTPGTTSYTSYIISGPDFGLGVNADVSVFNYQYMDDETLMVGFYTNNSFGEYWEAIASPSGLTNLTYLGNIENRTSRGRWESIHHTYDAGGGGFIDRESTYYVTTYLQERVPTLHLTGPDRSIEPVDPIHYHTTTRDFGIIERTDPLGVNAHIHQEQGIVYDRIVLKGRVGTGTTNNYTVRPYRIVGDQALEMKEWGVRVSSVEPLAMIQYSPHPLYLARRGRDRWGSGAVFPQLYFLEMTGDPPKSTGWIVGAIGMQ